MTYKKFKFSALLLLSLGLAGLQAQNNVIAAGGNTFGSEGSTSYSVGQVVYTTNSGTNGTVSQGIQQSYEISILTGLHETEGINIFLDIYPNPTTDYIIMKVKDFDKSNLFYQLFDINGKLLYSKKILENQTRINMANQIPSVYVLKVIHENKEIKIFKIIKNKKL